MPRDSPSRPLPLEGPFAPLGKIRRVKWVLGDEGRGHTGERRGRKETRCCECPVFLPNSSVWPSMFQAGARMVVEVGSKRQREEERESWKHPRSGAWKRGPGGKGTGDPGCHFSSPCLPVTSGRLARSTLPAPPCSGPTLSKDTDAEAWLPRSHLGYAV